MEIGNEKLEMRIAQLVIQHLHKASDDAPGMRDELKEAVALSHILRTRYMSELVSKGRPVLEKLSKMADAEMGAWVLEDEE